VTETIQKAAEAVRGVLGDRELDNLIEMLDGGGLLDFLDALENLPAPSPAPPADAPPRETAADPRRWLKRAQCVATRMGLRWPDGHLTSLADDLLDVWIDGRDAAPEGAGRCPECGCGRTRVDNEGDTGGGGA
jgi:hypothetical protein